MGLPKPYFERDGIAIYHGDCRDIAPKIKRVGAVISDPPYGISDTHKGHLGKVTLRSGKAAGRALEFEGISEKEMLCLVGAWTETASGWVVFTCEWKFCRPLADAGLLIRHGIWRKPDGAPQFTGDRPGTGWEAVAICHRPGKKVWNGGGHHAFWTFPKGQNKSGHPTGKPLGLFVSFVKDFTNPGDLILDPFAGSGTTLVACVRTGRRAIGIELEEKYCEIAAKRIEKEQRTPRLIAPEVLHRKTKKTKRRGFGF